MDGSIQNNTETIRKLCYNNDMCNFLMLNILSHDVLHDYLNNIDRWENVLTLLKKFNSETFTFSGGKKGGSGLFNFLFPSSDEKSSSDESTQGSNVGSEFSPRSNYSSDNNEYSLMETDTDTDTEAPTDKSPPQTESSKEKPVDNELLQISYNELLQIYYNIIDEFLISYEFANSNNKFQPQIKISDMFSLIEFTEKDHEKNLTEINNLRSLIYVLIPQAVLVSMKNNGSQDKAIETIGVADVATYLQTEYTDSTIIHDIVNEVMVTIAVFFFGIWDPEAPDLENKKASMSLKKASQTSQTSQTSQEKPLKLPGLKGGSPNHKNTPMTEDELNKMVYNIDTYRNSIVDIVSEMKIIYDNYNEDENDNNILYYQHRKLIQNGLKEIFKGYDQITSAGQCDNIFPMLPRLPRNSKASIVGAKVYKYTFDMFNENYELIRAPYVKELDRYNLITIMNIEKEQKDAHKEQMGKLTSTEMTSKNQFCRMIANLGLYALEFKSEGEKSEKNPSTLLLDHEINLMEICGTPGQNTDIDTHLWNTIKTQYTSTDTLDKYGRKKYVINNAAQQMSSWNKQVFCPLSSVKDGQLNCNEGQIGEYGDMSFMITTPIDNCGDDFENNTMYYNGIVSIIPWNNYPNATYELNIKTPKFGVVKLDKPPPDLIAWKVLQYVLTNLTNYFESEYIINNRTQIYYVPSPLDTTSFIHMTPSEFLLKDNPVEGIFGNVYEAIIYPYRKPIIKEVESSGKKEEKKTSKRKQDSNEPQKFKKSKPNAEKERSGSLTDAADAADAAEAAEDAAEAISKELLEIVWGILFKGTGDIFQEINALCKYGGYTSSPNYINNTEIIEWDKTGNTGNVKRIFFANDRPSASRFISMLKEGRDEDVNINASGGYKPSNTFLVKEKELTSDAAGGEKAGGGKRKTKRRSTQKKCKNTHKKKSIRKNTKNKQQVRKTCKIQRYRKHKYTNKRRQRKQNKKK